MKRTYTSTKKFKDLTKAIFKLYLFNDSKYGRDFDCDVKEWTYTDVTSFDIIAQGQEAEDIEKEIFPYFDEYGEYLILHFSDGSQATFRGSYVDMFILSNNIRRYKDMKKYYKVSHANVGSIQKSKELTYYGLTLLLDSFIHWKYEDSWFTDEHGEYFHNKNLNINKLYLTDDDYDNEIIINNLFNNLYDFYTNKLEVDKYLDIGDYDILIKEDTNNDK